VWFKSRYGAPFSTPERYWRTITPGEVATLAAAAALAYFAALAAVTRNRRGDAPLSLGIIAWLERMWDVSRQVERSFAAPQQAQFWYEWRQKGWAMPVTVAFGMFLGLAIWVIFSRNAEELFAGFVAGGGLLCVTALVGALVVGNASPFETGSEIGAFLATRPLTTPTMARVILKTAALSTLLAWLIWAAGFLVVYVILLAGRGLPPSSSVRWSWWYFPMTLLGAWTVLAVGVSIGLAGRTYLFVKVLCGVMFAYIGLILFARYALSYEAQLQFGRGATIAVGVAFLIGTLWAFAAARRRSLIGWTTSYVAASLWTVCTALVVLAWVYNPPAPLSVALLLIGAAALSVAPLAAAPLALAWNRHR
jgi:hypothetical protein